LAEKFQIQIPAEEIQNESFIRRTALQKAGLRDEGQLVHVYRRSIDARSRKVRYNLGIQILPKENQPSIPSIPRLTHVTNAPEVYIAGMGPAGIFAALELIRNGKKPIILERGKDVRARRRDLAAINKEHVVNPESNYCFGEGGAGTYSDGKLYTRSKKRGDIDEVLNTLIAFGADPDIAVDAHPHIGTNKLPKIITAMREFIIAAGGEVRFECKLTDIDYDSSGIRKIQVNGSDWIKTKNLILATGHSARDIFELLHRKGISIEAKPFALGVRVEHPQTLIDQIQYHCPTRPDTLPPASYSLVHQVGDKGVYSFCMCPGGIIAPCATAPGEIVTNGWSPSKRNNPFANSGIVVEIRPEHFKSFEKDGPLAALSFQAAVEKKAWEAGGESQTAPAQRLVDFTRGKRSDSLGPSSYQPGITSVELGEVLPAFVYSTLRAGFIAFGNKMKGYLTNEAIVHATESRTSSPVRIPRDEKTCQHTQVSGLYPCGEGAGYAGGIVSAAMDGIRVVNALVAKT
jgi:uncharacterized FAD-dependent dehydrogenase